MHTWHGDEVVGPNSVCVQPKAPRKVVVGAAQVLAPQREALAKAIFHHHWVPARTSNREVQPYSARLSRNSVFSLTLLSLSGTSGLNVRLDLKPPLLIVSRALTTIANARLSFATS